MVKLTKCSVKFGVKLLTHSQTSTNGGTVDIWELIRDIIPQFIIDVVLSCWDQVNHLRYQFNFSDVYLAHRNRLRSNGSISLIIFFQIVIVLPTYKCVMQWTFFSNIRWNMLPSESFRSDFYYQLWYSTWELQALQLIVLCLGVWYCYFTFSNLVLNNKGPFY